MRRNVAAVPKGDSLCLFCASRLLGLHLNGPRNLSRTSRRSLHTRTHLSQSSQTAAKPTLESQPTDNEGWGQTQASRGETSGGFGSGGDDGGWGSGNSSSIWETNTKVLGKSVPKPAAQTQHPDTRRQQSQPRWQIRRQPHDEIDQPRPNFKLRKPNILRQEFPRTEQPPSTRQFPVGREDRPTATASSTPRESDAVSSESKISNTSTTPEPATAGEGQGMRLRQELFQPRSFGLSDGTGRLQDGRSAIKRLNLDSLRQTAGPGTTAALVAPENAEGQRARGTAELRPENHAARNHTRNENSSTNTQQAHWQHLAFQQNESNRAAASSFTAPPAVSELDRLQAERQARKKKAAQGEVTGWGGGKAISWDTPRKSTKLDRESLGWDKPSTPTFKGITRVAIGSRKQESTPSPTPSVEESRSDGSIWDATPITEASEGPKAVSRVRRRDRFDLGKASDNRASQRPKGGGRRNRDEDDDEEIDNAALERMERREKRKAEKTQRRTEAPTPVILPDFISIGNLAAVLRVRAEEFANKLEELGFEEVTNDHIIGAEDAGLIAQEFNFEPVAAPVEKTREDLVAAPEPSPEDKELMLNRPPVITIMGHVDHGKTTLLDFLRKSSVAAGEHGGITQHIGAFTVEMPSGRTITFLDTPGHSAFLEMRQRGANVTDIVILVVAADDSVKPQTLEAIKHAQGANVPIIVAMSKIDKDEANPDRVKRDLAGAGVHVEDFGGDVQAIPVSGKTGQGMEDLEDAAIALADVLDVRADTSGNVEGWILESKLKPQGRVATVLMKRGTLKPGVILVAGTSWTRVRTIRDESGEIVSEATPGQPVEVDGWDDTPEAGAEALEAPNMQRARDVCELREDRAEAEKLAADVAATNEQRVEHRTQRALFKEQEALSKSRDVDEERAAELEAAAELARSNATSKFIRAPIVVRADVHGSAEAVTAAILAMGNTEIRAHVLREEVGAITASDIELVEAAQGAIVNFSQPIPGEMRRLLEKKGVKVIDGNVIYRITDAVKEHLEDKLPPLKTQRVLGEAEIAQVFQYKMKGRGMVPVAGCKVTNGIVEKGKNVKIFRAGEIVYDGVLESLKNHKRDVDSMQKGTECGMGFEKFTAFEAGDKLQVYEVTEERRKL